MALEATVFGDSSTYDILIIGSGPAGLTAAIYARKANLKTGFIEKDVPGGKLVNLKDINNYPGFKSINGADLALNFYEHATEAGAEYIYGHVTQVVQKLNYHAVYTEDGSTRYAKACIIATGVNENKLQIAGADALTNKGISYCAVCDGSLANGKPVIVYGHSQEAINNAVYLSSIASKIYLISPNDQFDVDLSLIKQLKNIEIITGASIKEAKGTEKLESVILSNDKSIICAYLFVFIGHHAASELLNNKVLINDDGTIKVNENKETSIPGLYAIGDVSKTMFRQIVTAANDGTIAALNAIKYIKQQ
jgi:thioredoxin reductase (NADPH)